ncbi:helix-turn-helix domain-containing protein [Bacillus sp. FJAT-29814]|uniref:winged helix-turn-helix transcriptional regulator n=1 Tax=Bacillus sp. FJAT-29814 TaxID=1729688 RepID=UPI00082D594A|nr:helix-turn-helix domain-containing protein [Bacillus sp. FJAT-29814]
MKKKYNLPCNIANTLDIIGDRWTLLIVRDIMNGITKFNELKDSLTGIAPNILSDRLQLLEKEGLIVSKIYSKHPPRYEYELTQDGWSLKDVLFALAIWGNNHFEKTYYRVVDKVCDHEVRLTYACPHCETYTDKPVLKPIND